MPYAVLFVCLGNICRSPLAEGIFRSLVEEAGAQERYAIDSAGTGAWHAGQPPDSRSIAVAARKGIDLTKQRARQVCADDFRRFDVIVAMDRDNLTALERQNIGAGAEVRLLLETPAKDVPDPYYGGPEGFDNVFTLVRQGCRDLLTRLEAGT